MSDYITMLTGERIELGPIRRELIGTYLKWFNDLDVMRTLAVTNLPMTFEAEEQWFATAAANRNEAIFTIYIRETGEPIGNAGLHNIDHEHGTANFGIVIGEKSAWNRGYGTETTRLMLQYGFDILGLENVMLEVHGTNPGAIRAYEKAGFQSIGVRRSAFKLGRERTDIFLMDAIAADFQPSELQFLLRDGPNRD